jgi:hypothetical protein
MVKTTKETGNTENKETTQAPKTDAAIALEQLVSVLGTVAETNKQVLAKLEVMAATKTPAAKKTKAKVELTPEAQQEKENKQTEREVEYARLEAANKAAGRTMPNARFYCSEVTCRFAQSGTYNGPGSMKDGMPNDPWVKHLEKNPGHTMLVV